MRDVKSVCFDCEREFVVSVGEKAPDTIATSCPHCGYITLVHTRPPNEIDRLRAIAEAGYRILITFVDDQVVGHLSHKKYTNGTLLPEYVGSTFAAVLRQCYDAAMEAV
ncbi:MAG: hypothetical protein M0R06_12285 [Sphaerochaeta sp.]|jgi:DNA-directed RNA polymerase subunit RPC12/RpoP|nr:hypothetical protein [Sphaerochaeta sp.]